MRVDVRAPRVDPAGLHAELLERLADLSGELRRLVPAARPGLDHDAVEEDVRQRRLVPLFARGLLRLGKSRPRAVEVVDVTKPLPELEDHPRVDRGRRCIASSLRALGRRRVEAFAQEQVGANPRAERHGDESRLRVGERLEQLERARAAPAAFVRFSVPAFIAIAAWQRPRTSASRRAQRLLRERDRGRLPDPPVVDLRQRQQCRARRSPARDPPQLPSTADARWKSPAC